MAGEEFAQAIVRFVADDSAFNAGLDRIEQRTKQAASRADQAFRQSFVRALGEGGFGNPSGSGEGRQRGAQTEQERVAALEKAIDRLRESRAKAAKAGQDVSAGFAEGFKSGLAGIDKPLEDLGTKIGGIARFLTSPTALIAGGVLAIGAAVVDSTKKALDFDAAFRDFAVFIDPAAESIEKLRARVVALDPSLGGATERLRALKEAFLDTGNLDKAFAIEQVSAKLNKITGLSREAGVQVLGSLADAFSQTGTNVEHIGDVLLEVQRKGGGSIGELGNGFLGLADAAATLNIGIDDLGAALITLGERAGANPQKNIQALTLLLRTLSLNTAEFRARGFDVKDVIKTEGFTGLLRIMREATQGSEEQLKELGISGRNVTTILKVLSDEGVATFAKKLDDLQKSAPSAADRALETRGKFISNTIEEASKTLEAAQLTFGERILGVARTKVQGNAKDQLTQVRALITDATKEIEPLLKQREREGDLFGKINTGDKFRLESLQKQKGEYEVLADKLGKVVEAQQKVEDEQNGLTESTNKLTDAKQKGVDLTTQEIAANIALGDALRQLDTDRLIRSTDDAAKASQRQKELIEARGQAEVATLEAERSVDQIRAGLEGRQVKGLEDLLATRKRVLAEGTAETLKAIETQSAAQIKGLEADRARIAAALEVRQGRLSSRPGDAAIKAEIATLTNQLEAADQKVTDARAEQIQKRRLAEIKANQDRAQDEAKAFQERQAQIARDIQLEDERFRKRKALGEATIDEEIARSRAASTDPRRTEADRISAIEQTKQKERALDEQTFALRRTLGEATLVDEVARQARITASYRQGTQERLDAEKSLADKTKALREQAAQAGQGLIGTATSRLQARGIDTASREEIAQEIAALRQESQQSIGDFAAGGQVNLSDLGSAFQASGQFKQLNDLGVGPSQAIGVSLGEASKNLSTGLLGGATAVDDFTRAVRGATSAIGGGGGGEAGGPRAGGGFGGGSNIRVAPAPGGGLMNVEVSDRVAAVHPLDYAGMAKATGADFAEAQIAAEKARGELAAARAFQDSLNGPQSLETLRIAGGASYDSVRDSHRQAALFQITQGNEASAAARAENGDAGDVAAQAGDAMSGKYMTALDSMKAATVDFFQEWGALIQAGSSQIADNLFETFMTKVTRRLQDEARRQ